jgi:hypothetical protein
MSEISLSNESRFIKFSLLVLFGTVSTICTLYIIYNVIKIPLFRNRFQNQTLIILVLFNTIFNISTTFRYIYIEIILIIFFLIVFSLVDMFHLKVTFFVVLGKYSIIVLLHLLFGGRQYLFLNDIFLYFIQIIFVFKNKN